MQTILAIFLTLSFTITSQAFISKFPSSVDTIEIPNTHVILADENNKPIVLRGNAPRDEWDVRQLYDFGIEKVIIFKKQTRSEVNEEKVWLKEHRITYQHIPFLYKNFPSFKSACKQTISAFKSIQKAFDTKKPLFFHCTVGEDRTGYLAGLTRIYFQNWKPHWAFEAELCQNGYGAGNPTKPFKNVVQEIQQDMTPIFAQMAYLLTNTEEIDSSICERNAWAEMNKQELSYYKKLANLKCEPSPKHPAFIQIKKAVKALNMIAPLLPKPKDSLW